MPQEIRPIVTGIRIPGEGVGPRVERRRGEALLVDVRQRRGVAGVADAEEVEVRGVGVAAVGGEERQRVEAAAVVVDLALEALQLAAVDEVPVAAGVAVPAPVRDGRHVGDDGADGLVGRRRVVEVSGLQVSIRNPSLSFPHHQGPSTHLVQ